MVLKVCYHEDDIFQLKRKLIETSKKLYYKLLKNKIFITNSISKHTFSDAL